MRGLVLGLVILGASVMVGYAEEQPKDSIVGTYVITGTTKFGGEPLAKDATGENVVITVTYSRGEGGHREGSLRPGESVELKNGMVFDVSATDRS